MSSRNFDIVTGFTHPRQFDFTILKKSLKVTLAQDKKPRETIIVYYQ